MTVNQIWIVYFSSTYILLTTWGVTGKDCILKFDRYFLVGARPLVELTERSGRPSVAGANGGNTSVLILTSHPNTNGGATNVAGLFPHYR